MTRHFALLLPLLLAACSSGPSQQITSWTDFSARLDRGEFSQVAFKDEGLVIATLKSGGTVAVKLPGASLSGPGWEDFKARAEKVACKIVVETTTAPAPTSAPRP